MHPSGYFDANATTPLFAAARAVFVEALERNWHNPSSLYHEAGAVRRALETARDQLADQLGLSDSHRIVFTSGATESNNLLLRHFAATAPTDSTIVTSHVEHPCLREPAATLFPARVVEAPFELPETLDLIRNRQPALVSVMAANNETGVLHPWHELCSLCRELEIPFHTDAAQWIGKMPLEGIGECDWITGSSHKFGGPKGAGFLVVPSDLPKLHGSFSGGPQEQGRRAGTENTPAVLAMCTALEEAESLLSGCTHSGRDAFEARLRELLPGTRFVGAKRPRLWNTSLFCLPEFGNLKWLTRLSHLGFQVSTGSACSSGAGHPSHVMEAMGLPPSEMGRVLRASSLWQTRLEDWISLADAIEQVGAELENPTPESRLRRKVQG